jgi:uncharacterized protein
MAGTYVIKKSGDDKFFFNLKADNHETVLTSETYNQKAGALEGIESVKTNSPLDERYERKESSKGKHFFVLKAANHQVIGTSEEYSSEKAMEDGISAVKKLGPSANIKDEA